MLSLKNSNRTLIKKNRQSKLSLLVLAALCLSARFALASQGEAEVSKKTAASIDLVQNAPAYITTPHRAVISAEVTARVLAINHPPYRARFIEYDKAWEIVYNTRSLLYSTAITLLNDAQREMLRSYRDLTKQNENENETSGESIEGVATLLEGELTTDKKNFFRDIKTKQGGKNKILVWLNDIEYYAALQQAVARLKEAEEEYRTFTQNAGADVRKLELEISQRDYFLMVAATSVALKNLRACYIKCPYEMTTVVEYMVKPGEVVQKNGPVLSVVDSSKLYIKFALAQEHYANASKGKEFKFNMARVEQCENCKNPSSNAKCSCKLVSKDYGAQVTWRRPRVNPTSKFFEVYAKILHSKSEPPDFAVGMTGYVKRRQFGYFRGR